jgi:L-aminopeptidase/D-esterase-like protein
VTDAGWVSGAKDAITDVAGVRVGHWTDRRAATGCTVILCEGSTQAAVDVRGGAPGTRETDVLQPANLVRRCDAIVFAGGSAFGLAAATGVMRWCAERDIGFATTAGHVPIVSGAVIFDLAVGMAGAFPGEEEGYRAAAAARSGSVRRGSVGAGTGATVAKLLGAERAMKGGLGTSSVAGPRGLLVGALAVVNAVGHVFDPERGELIAGPRDERGSFVDLPRSLRERRRQMEALVENTTLVCVVTNATIEHGALQRLAYQAHDGLARTIMPAHTAGDGHGHLRGPARDHRRRVQRSRAPWCSISKRIFDARQIVNRT